MTDLLHWDQQLFHLINGIWTAGWLDALLPLWRNKYIWMPVYIFLISFLLINFGKKGGYLLLFLLFTVIISDIVSSQLVKKTVQRERPCNDERIQDMVVLRVSCGGGYSFTSSHATNHFAMAFFLLFTLGQRFKSLRWVLFLWAASIAYAQVYVGVHYPLDVIAGSLIGIFIGTLVAALYSSIKDIDFLSSSFHSSFTHIQKS